MAALDARGSTRGGAVVTSAVCRLNALRTARAHLEAQVDARGDTRYASYAEARKALAEVQAEIHTLEAALRETPGHEYLFAGRRRRRRR